MAGEGARRPAACAVATPAARPGTGRQHPGRRAASSGRGHAAAMTGRRGAGRQHAERRAARRARVCEEAAAHDRPIEPVVAAAPRALVAARARHARAAQAAQLGPLRVRVRLQPLEQHLDVEARDVVPHNHLRAWHACVRGRRRENGQEGHGWQQRPQRPAKARRARRTDNEGERAQDGQNEKDEHGKEKASVLG